MIAMSTRALIVRMIIEVRVLMMIVRPTRALIVRTIMEVCKC